MQSIKNLVMKNSKIIINCIIFALGLVNVVLLGYFCDEYPSVIVKNIVFISLYSIVFASFANMLFLIIFQEKYSTKKIAKAVSLILLTIFIVLLVYEFSVYKKTINRYSKDYISASNINGVSLYKFQENFNSNEEVLFYIGREDCAECLSFENILNELLEQSNLVLPAYYTNLDRNGKKET